MCVSCRRDLPFPQSSHLHNPWNEGKLVKVGRDGQVVRFSRDLCSVVTISKTSTGSAASQQQVRMQPHKLSFHFHPSPQKFVSIPSCLTVTHTHTRSTAPFPGLSRWAVTRKVKPVWILLKQETMSGSGISWAICKSARLYGAIQICLLLLLLWKNVWSWQLIDRLIIKYSMNRWNQSTFLNLKLHLFLVEQHKSWNELLHFSILPKSCSFFPAIVLTAAFVSMFTLAVQYWLLFS